MKNITFTIIAIAIFPILLSSQKLIKAKKLLSDFDDMLEAIEAHPDPYRHVPEAEFEKMADSLRSLITEPMQVKSFFKICSPLIHVIKDGHTNLNLPQNQIRKHIKEYGAFPYHIYLSDDEKMYVIKNYGEDKTIPIGAEIISINGISIPEFVNSIDEFTFYERKSFRNTQIESDINILLYLHFGTFKELEIEYFTDHAEVHTLSNIDYKIFKNSKKEQELNIMRMIRDSKPFEYKKITKDVGHLMIHSFLIIKPKVLARFLKKMFKNIKEDGVTSLIIDVRGNLGGFPRASAEIYHYLTDLPFKTMAVSKMKISHTYRNQYKNKYPHVNFNSIPFRKEGYTVDRYTLFNGEVGTLATEMNSNNELGRTEENEFSGDLYLLTDRTSFSAASSFAATFRCYGLGIIVGEPTGGTKTFFGNSITIELKHSDINLRIGTVKNYTTCFTENEDEPIIPDVEVSPSVLDRINDSDQTLYYTLNLIKKIKKTREKKD